MRRRFPDEINYKHFELKVNSLHTETYLSNFGQFELSEDVVVCGRLSDVANAHGAVLLQSVHVGPVLHTLTLSRHNNVHFVTFPSLH